MPQSPIARALLSLGLGLIVLALGLAAWLWSHPEQAGLTTSGTVTTSGTALVGGPFQLTDQTGQARSDQDFRDKLMLVYFGYTHCPDFCPAALSVMSQALDHLAESNPDAAEQVVPIFITVDPARDTVDALADYAEHFHDSLVALTGSDQAVADAAGAYRVYFAKVEDEGSDDYLMDHTTVVFLMDREGKYVTHFNHTATAEEMAENLARTAKP